MFREGFRTLHQTLGHAAAHPGEGQSLGYRETVFQVCGGWGVKKEEKGLSRLPTTALLALQACGLQDLDFQ